VIPDTHLEAVDLKKKQIGTFKIIATLYFIVAIVYELYAAVYTNVDQVSSNEYLREWIYVGRACFNCIIYSWLLWVFRPRKEWPQFYTLEINEIGGRREIGNGRFRNKKMGQMNDCLLTNDTLKTTKEGLDLEDDVISKLEDNEQIIILNPCEDTMVQAARVSENLSDIRKGYNINPSLPGDIMQDLVNGMGIEQECSDPDHQMRKKQIYGSL